MRNRNRKTRGPFQGRSYVTKTKQPETGEYPKATQQSDCSCRNQESVYKKCPALYNLAFRLTDHSGYNASLLFSAKDCPLLRDILFPEPPTLPEPADWSLRHTSEAVCCVCNDFSADAFHDGDSANLRDLYQCAACNQWWHLEHRSPLKCSL